MADFTYDTSTDCGKVRMLVPDRIEADAVFTDTEIAAFLELEDDNVRCAAALALETIASDEALVLKVIKIADLQTDGAKTSDALLKRAALLRQQGAEETYDDEIDVIEIVPNQFAYRERVYNEMLRGS